MVTSHFHSTGMCFASPVCLEHVHVRPRVHAGRAEGALQLKQAHNSVLLHSAANGQKLHRIPLKSQNCLNFREVFASFY